MHVCRHEVTKLSGLFRKSRSALNPPSRSFALEGIAAMMKGQSVHLMPISSCVGSSYLILRYFLLLDGMRVFSTSNLAQTCIKRVYFDDPIGYVSNICARFHSIPFRCRTRNSPPTSNLHTPTDVTKSVFHLHLTFSEVSATLISASECLLLDRILKFDSQSNQPTFFTLLFDATG